MATFLWTNLSDGERLAFNPLADVLNVNDPSISAAALEAQVAKTKLTLSYDGKIVTLLMDARAATTGNITFSDGSLLIIGDNTTGTTQDPAANSLAGGTGDDHLIGVAGNDRLLGAQGDDRLHGNDGRDTLNGGSGVDSMSGGTGNDTYVVGDTADVVQETAGEGAQDIVRSSVSYTLPQNVERLILIGSAEIDGSGNVEDNIITGNGNENLVRGGGGDDNLVGGAGNDTLEGGNGNDTLDGGAGDDTLIGGAGDDLYIRDGTEVVVESEGGGVDAVMMTAGLDAPANVENITYVGDADNIGFDANDLDNFITGNALSQSMRAGLGNDTVSYAYEANAVTVDLGDETAIGSGNDTITGFENALGGAADDTLIGSGVDNLLDGQGGADSMEGGGGNDVYLVDDVDDFVFETDNGPVALTDGESAAALDGFTDTVIAVVNYSLENVEFVENLTLNGTSTEGTGNGLNNVITGNNLANALSGLGGADTLEGAAGNDLLRGGIGADTLNGREGKDTCTGGGGADRFVFSTTLSAKPDQITDFNAAADVIHLDNDIFTAFGSFVGELAAGRFVSGSGVIAAGDAGDRIIYNTNTGALYYDADGTGGQETATRFATLTNTPTITAGDFFIVS